MYNEQLEQLIEFALADGELTEKERLILNKKAVEFGIDIDEFEMVLGARLHQRKNQQLTETTTGNEKKEDVKKCPSCGATINSLSTKCADCGYDFRNVKSNNSIQRLFDMLNEAEIDRAQSTSNMFGKLQSMFGTTNTDKRKLEIISSFPIPTTKEDMLEFLSLALPKSKIKKIFGILEADKNKVPNLYAKTWLQKCEQIIMKARFSMKEDKKGLQEIEYYAQQLKIK